VAPELELA